MGESHESAKDWEDASTDLSSGTSDAFKAAWYLTTNRIWPLVRSPRSGPIVLGIVLAILVVASVLLSPTAESRFIYTDF
jgi:hypothetical protein